MSNGTTPKLTGKDGIKLEKKLSYILTCPKCEGNIDVTVIKAGTHIECGCGNVTWRPDYNPPWWAKTKIFVISLITTLIIGIISTYIVTMVITNQQDAVKKISNSNNTNDTLKTK